MSYNEQTQSDALQIAQQITQRRMAKEIERRVRALGNAGGHATEQMAMAYERAMRTYQLSGRIAITIPAGHRNRDTRRGAIIRATRSRYGGLPAV